MSAASGLEHLKPFLPGLESALEDSEVSEIMINGPGNVWIERSGRLTAYEAPNLDGAALLRAAIHIARPLGLDPASSPIVDARLDDGSRVAGRSGHDPRSRAPRSASPPGSHRGGRGLRRRGRRPAASPEHRPRWIAHDRTRQQRRERLVTNRQLRHARRAGSFPGKSPVAGWWTGSPWSFT